jgi:hypothetical protein
MNRTSTLEELDRHVPRRVRQVAEEPGEPVPDAVPAPQHALGRDQHGVLCVVGGDLLEVAGRQGCRVVVKISCGVRDMAISWGPTVRAGRRSLLAPPSAVQR